jgi:hypothetical protein
MGLRLRSRTRRTGRMAAVGLALFSALATLPVLVGLVAFDAKPGEASSAPATWPHNSGIRRAAGDAQLLVFVHPFCTCTTATIAELEHLSSLHGGPGSPSITFLVIRPTTDAGWTWKELPEIREGIPEAKVVWDEGGLEAGTFHTSTSGTVLLYSAEGKLRFEGGITESRGHVGDNYGLDELARAINATAASRPMSSQVFGCSLGAEPGGNLTLGASLERALRDIRRVL